MSPITESDRIFHLTTPAAWTDAQASGQLVPPGFEEEGFVHCSTPPQLVGTISKHFQGIDELDLLELDATALGDALVWEEGRPGQIFPHVYRPLSPDDVIGVVRWTRDADGGVSEPGGL